MRDFNLDPTASPTSTALAPLPATYVEEQAAPRVFSHPTFGNLRVIVDEQTGEPWFMAKDVAVALGLSNIREAVTQLDEDEKNTVRVPDGKRGNPNITIISEPGLYALIVRSNKTEARAFSRWVRHEVLPAIRKYGGYLTPQLTTEALIDPDTIINLATALKKDREKLAAARQEVFGLQSNLTKVRQEQAQLTADLAEAMPKAALVDEAFAPKHNSDEEGRVVRLQDVVRKLEHANSMAIKRDLYRMGYLYKRNGVYRVYSKYRETIFKERWSHEHGKQEIYATKDGAALIVKLYREGSLTRKGQKSA